MSETLRQAVETQARARVAGDDVSFASYFTPQALTRARTLRLSKPRTCEVLSITSSGATGSSDVLYGGRDAHVLAQRWQLLDGVWTVVDVDRVRAPRRTIWHRLSAPLRRRDHSDAAPVSSDWAPGGPGARSFEAFEVDRGPARSSEADGEVA